MASQNPDISDGYHIADPAVTFPGCLSVLVPSARAVEYNELVARGLKRAFMAKALLSDHIPLAGDVRDILHRPSQHLLKVNGESFPLYLQHGSREVVYFDLCRGETGDLSHLQTGIVASNPLRVFPVARSLFNQLLDVLMREVWMPLVIMRVDLYLKGGGQALAHQILFPFDIRMSIGPLGGYGQVPVLLPYESLLREAVVSTSPYWRFLCACRLYDGIPALRSWIRKTAEQLSVSEAMPSDPPVDMALLRNVGLREEYVTGVKTAKDLRGKFTEQRNLLAHFLNRENPTPVDFSQGISQRDYALSGTLMLFYAQQALAELRIYILRNLNGLMKRGAILPEPEHRARFVVDADKFFQPLQEPE